MPIITLEITKLSKEKKQELAKKYTEITSEITGIDKEAFVVIFNENDMDNIATGGVLLSDKFNK